MRAADAGTNEHPRLAEFPRPVKGGNECVRAWRFRWSGKGGGLSTAWKVEDEKIASSRTCLVVL
jgi:hypothetical protein